MDYCGSGAMKQDPAPAAHAAPAPNARRDRFVAALLVLGCVVVAVFTGFIAFLSGLGWIGSGLFAFLTFMVPFACLSYGCGFTGHTSDWAQAVTEMEGHAEARHNGTASFDVNQGKALLEMTP